MTEKVKKTFRSRQSRRKKMNDINNIFFELINVVVGNSVCISCTPSEDEWDKLYEIAKKQSSVGVCFAGVQKLVSQMQSPPEQLYLQWLGMTAKIQQKNEDLKKRCEKLITQFKNAGMDACVLKGLSLSCYYGELAALRQSGDIDVWVRNKSIEELDAYVKGLGFAPKTTAAHVSYEDASTGAAQAVEIELHAVPAFLRCPWMNARLRKWFQNVDKNSNEFNQVFLMVHMYHHVLFEGLGLRQVMDYYMMLRTQVNDDRLKNKDGVLRVFKDLGMMRFVRGVMWIMKEVFNSEEDSLLCEYDEKIGRLLLSEIMHGGNFGKYDAGAKGLHHESAIVRGKNSLQRNVRFFVIGATEILCSPPWSLWHWWWRKKRNY